MSEEQSASVTPELGPKRWWERPVGIVALGILVTVVGGIILWLILRPFDKPTTSTAIEPPKAQSQSPPLQLESKPQESAPPQSNHKRSDGKEKASPKEYPIKPGSPAPKKNPNSPPTKDLDIVCQKLEECPSPELRKRAFLLIHRLEDLYSEFDKEYNRITTDFGDAAHQGAREAMIRGLRARMSSRYRNDHEAQVLEYRRVMIDRLPPGTADHSNDWFYNSQGPNWVMYTIIEHVNNIADDLRHLASQLPEN
jgi:hypothetical protein